MTDFSTSTVQLAEPTFEEPVEILGRELEMAVKWQRPCILLVVYSSEYARNDAQAKLEKYLIGLNQKLGHISIKDQDAVNISNLLREFADPAHTVFFVDGLRKGNSKQGNLYALLNSQKDFFKEMQIRVIFWLTQNQAIDFAHDAPDLWTQRHYLIELFEALKAEQSLQRNIESVWLEFEDYTEAIEEANAKTSLCDSLLSNYLEEDESISTHANWLLNFGILYWRKGDYERADRLLREALKSASKIQDNRFEAECFNAIALVKTSLGSIHEATDAYKQAIQLAPDQFFAWNNLGNLCLKIFHNDEAMIAFQKAIARNPKDPIGWNGLGNVYFIMGYIEDAITSYRKAISFMPTFAQPWNGLGDVYSAAGRIDEAIKAYRKAIELNREYVTPWLRLGILFLRQERYREAIKAYQSALSLDSKNSAIWNDLGSIYLKCESYEEAAEVFSKTIQLNHEDGWAHHNLALTYIHQEKYSEAASLLLKSVDLFREEKDKAMSWNQLANVYRLLNDYDNAIAAYQIADTLDPKTRAPRNKNAPDKPTSIVSSDKQISNPETVASEPTNIPSGPQKTLKDNSMPDPGNEFSTAESEQKLIETPLWIFDLVNEKELKDSSTKKDQGTLSKNQEPSMPVLVRPEQLKAKGAKMSNLKSTNELHSQNPASTGNHTLEPKSPEEIKVANADMWNAKGNAHFQRGEMEQAIQAYNKAIQLDTSFGWPYSNLALTYLTQGQYAEAILLYERSLELLSSDKDKAVSWNGLGNIYRCINDYENAVAAYQKAAELDPDTAGMREGANNLQGDQNMNNSQTWNDLGEAFFKAGTYDRAIDAFYKAIELGPDNGWPYANLARVLVSRNQYENAIALYQKSIGLLKNDKDKAAVWNRLGNAYRKLNDYDNAIKAYQKAVILADEGVNLLTRTRFSLLSNCNVD